MRKEVDNELGPCPELKFDFRNISTFSRLYLTETGGLTVHNKVIYSSGGTMINNEYKIHIEKGSKDDISFTTAFDEKATKKNWKTLKNHSLSGC